MVEIFLGAEIEESSERLFLMRLRTALEDSGISAIVLGNFLAGRNGLQIDFVVATSNGGSVVELKSYSLPIDGSINGSWSRLNPDGSRTDLGNPYRQTLSAKYAVSDEMGRYSASRPTLLPRDGHYRVLEGALCLFPEAPAGSQVPPGDFKVRIVDFAGFLRLIGGITPPGVWSLDEWRRFAGFLGLREVDPSSLDATIKSAGVAIEEYRRRLAATLSSIPPLCPTNVKSGTSVYRSDALFERISEGHILLVTGPSGSGKSHAVKHGIVSSLAKNTVSIFLPARYFKDDFDRFLDRCVSHLHPNSAVDLFRAAAEVGARPILVVDGLNELPPDSVRMLLEGLQGFLLRNPIPTILTCQNCLDPTMAIAVDTVAFEPLTDVERLAIYSSHSGGIPPDRWGPFRTAYAVSLAAKCSQEGFGAQTMHGLLGAYVRRCLTAGDARGLGFQALKRIARVMSERLRTTIDLKEFYRETERYFVASGADPRLADIVLGSGLLIVEHGECAFVHELLQRFFEVEELLGDFAGMELAEVLARPRNKEAARLAVGGLRTPEEVREVLRCLQSAEIILDCLFGRNGEQAQATATGEVIHWLEDIEEVLSKAIPTALLNTERAQMPSASQYELALANALGRALTEGILIERVQGLLSRLDRVWGNTIKKGGVKRSSLSTFFNNLCVFPSFGLGAMFHEAEFGRVFRSEELVLPVQAALQDLVCQEGPFSLYLAAALMHSSQATYVRGMTEFIQRAWATDVYNVQLAAVTQAGGMGGIEDEAARAELVEALNELDSRGNIFLSTAVIETLSRLGGIESPVDVEGASSQIEDALADPDDPDHQQQAYSIISRMFEDVFQGVYFEAIETLDQEKREMLYVMAARASLEPDHVFMRDFIIGKIVRSSNPRAVAVLRQLASPPSQSFYPQGVVSGFALAFIGLASHDAEPPQPKGPVREVEYAWHLYGEILFWLAKALPADQLSERCTPLWAALLGPTMRYAAVDPLMWLEKEAAQAKFTRERDGAEGHSIVVAFPGEVCDLLTSVVPDLDKLRSVFNFAKGDYRRREHGQFVLEMLGRVGTEENIELLDSLSDSPNLGEAAVSAIRSIRARRDTPTR